MICLYDPHSQLSTYLKCGPAAIRTAAFQSRAAPQRRVGHSELSGRRFTDQETEAQKGGGTCQGEGQNGNESWKSLGTLRLFGSFKASLWKSLCIDDNGNLCQESWSGQGWI